MASDEIMLTINDKGELAEFKEPYVEILVETEEDYSYIEDALNIVKRLENIIKEKGKINIDGEEITSFEMLKAAFGKEDIKSKEELDEELCSYCPYTEYGQAEVNTGPYNLCEGGRCDDAYENYKESWERDNGDKA